MNLTELDASVLLSFLTEQPSMMFPLSKVNQKLRNISLESFRIAGRDMAREIPSLLPEMKEESITTGNALQIFMRLVKRLHDQAEVFNCNQMYEKGAGVFDRMAWESEHFSSLIREVKERMQQAKEEDFQKFVEAVASAISIDIPAGSKPRQFWEESLKGNLKIQDIKNLNLFKKDLRFLPPEISRLSHLEVLSLGSNRLRELPVELASLAHLKRLDVSHNLIWNLHAQAFPDCLEHLKLSNNQLSEIPASFASLSSLNYLDASQNPICQIPGVIASLANLTHLYLNEVKLQSMPCRSELPPKIQELYLSNNEIEEITKETVDSLAGLRKLFLYKNPLAASSRKVLSSIPKSFGSGLDLKWDSDLDVPRWGE